MQRGQSNCHASSQRHSSQALRLKEAGAAPGEDGSSMLGQKSTQLPRFGHSRYSAGKTVSFAFVTVARAAVARHRVLLLHARANVRDIRRLRDILRIRISRANGGAWISDRQDSNRPWQYWNGRSRTGFSREDHVCLRQSVCRPDMATCSWRS